MAVRGWGGSVAAAIGVAAGAGAAQLGLGYGLGIISWLPAADRAGEATWAASLAWAAWIAATSTVAGAIGASRLAGDTAGNTAADEADDDRATTALWRISLAVAAAVGGLVTVALVAVPARAAVRADTFSPQTIAAGYAVLGVIIGLAVAVWALNSPAVAANVMATIAWLWLLAVVAVVDGVFSGRGLTTAQLGVWQITADSERFWFRDYLYWPGAALALGSAFVIGALTARGPARDPHRRVGTAVSGVVGPLMVAAAYFLAAPRLVGIRAEQLSAHLIAPYAVLAGLAGSVLVTALAQRADRRAAATRAVVPAQRDADATAHLYDAGAFRGSVDEGHDPDDLDRGPDPDRSDWPGPPDTGGDRDRATVPAPLWPNYPKPEGEAPEAKPVWRRLGRGR
jgi:hypothetical protein